MRLAPLFFALALAGTQAQESPGPMASPSPASSSPTASPTSTPPSPVRSVRLRFALPPLQGTISLGIYDGSGKLVRVLHREDKITDFTTGNDALETTWDGNDDKEKPLPDGKYSARGYVVGDLKVEGIDYFFNDWVKDDKSPHIRRLTQLWKDNGELRIDAELAGGRRTSFAFDPASGTMLNEVPAFVGRHCQDAPTLAYVAEVIDCARGKNGTTWSVDALTGGGPRQVRQIAHGHEVLRRLDYVADDPQPTLIEASSTADEIFVVEQNHLLQRFRGLALVQTIRAGTEGPISEWKSLFDKKIIEHEHFAIANGKPVPASLTAENGPKQLTQALEPNPLQHDHPGKLDLAVDKDADGSYLETTDGLPLRTISDTPNLTRILLERHDDKSVDLFQDDGAVVEQYRVSGLDQMMAFDCGEFELK